MKSIGIKLADGSFYPILEEGSLETKDLEVTTVKDNQTKVQIDLYRSESNSMDDAEYVDSLEITQLKPHPNGEPSLNLQLNLDSDNHLHAQMKDPETGKTSETQVTLISRTLEERTEPANFALNDSNQGPIPTVDAVNSILNSPNDEEFSFDPATDIPDISDDEDDTTIDLDSLDIDSFEAVQVSDDFMTDSQIVDDDIVSSDPLTDQDMLSPADLFNDEPKETKEDDLFIDKDGTGFSFVDDNEEEAAATEVTEPKVEVSNEIDSDTNDFQIPSTLLDPGLFDETSDSKTFEDQELSTEDIDTNIEPPDFSNFELDDIEDSISDDNIDSPELGSSEEFSEPSTAANASEEDTSYNIPDFDDLPTEESFSEINVEPVPETKVEETVTTDTESNPYDLPDYDDLGISDDIDTDIAPTNLDLSDSFEEDIAKDEASEEPEIEEKESLTLPDIDTDATDTAIDNSDSDFNIDDLDLDNIGDVDLSSTEEPSPEPDARENIDISLNLPDFGEDGSADIDFGFDNSIDTTLAIDSTSEETQESGDSTFDISVMDLPNFDDLDTQTESNESFASGLPNFDDPFASLSSPTANTDFDFPDFDDSPAKMELNSELEDSQTKEIFGDFDDTDAVFEGDTDGFIDPTRSKKKAKKQKKTSKAYGAYSELSDSPSNEDDKNSKKPIIILLAALLACLVVILVLILQSRTPKSVKKASQEIAKLQKTESAVKQEDTDSDIEKISVTNSELVTSMGEPRKNTETTIIETQKPSTESASTATSDKKADSKKVESEVPNKTVESKTVEEPAVKRPTVETAKRVEAPTVVTIPAKEDTIIVASNAETIVPLEKPKSTGNSASDIKYTVVWGDTLWDISTAYYKTPYRYNRIAEYNGLTDANRIKSGQILLIPAE